MTTMARTGDCRHFNGCQNDSCKAGVDYQKLVGDGITAWTAHLPCLPNSSLRKDPLAKCDKHDAWTEKEEKAFQKESKERGNLTVRAIGAIRKLGKDSGTIVCPKCGENLRFSVAKLNGHIWGKCSTDGCLAWMM